LLAQQDQFERLLPTFIQVIDLTEQEESEYWMVVSAVVEGKEILTVPASSMYGERSISSPVTPTPPTPSTDPVNNKVSLSLSPYRVLVLVFYFMLFWVVFNVLAVWQLILAYITQ
jgi:hypothetical protein